MASWFKKMTSALVGNELDDEEYEYLPEYEEERDFQQQSQARTNRDASRDSNRDSSRETSRDYRNQNINQNQNQNMNYNQGTYRDSSRDNNRGDNRGFNDKNIKEAPGNGNSNSRNGNGDFNRNDPKVVRLNTGVLSEICVSRPATIEDALEACISLKENKTCLVNLEEVQNNEAQRIIDFLSGAAEALNGTVKRVSGDIFLVCPAHTSINELGRVKEQIKQGSFVFSKAGYR